MLEVMLLPLVGGCTCLTGQLVCAAPMRTTIWNAAILQQCILNTLDVSRKLQTRLYPDNTPGFGKSVAKHIISCLRWGRPATGYSQARKHDSIDGTMTQNGCRSITTLAR
jgi:hypothetical protein